MQIVQADFVEWLKRNQSAVKGGEMPRFHAFLGDTPYFLGSINRRFSKANSAPAQYGKDGAFQRQSRGFMGQT